MRVKVKKNYAFLPLTKFKILPFAKLFCKKDFALFQNYKNTLAIEIMV